MRHSRKTAVEKNKGKKDKSQRWGELFFLWPRVLKGWQ